MQMTKRDSKGSLPASLPKARDARGVEGVIVADN